MARSTNNAIILTKQIVEKEAIPEYGLNGKAIINFLFRHESLIDNNNKIRTPNSLNLELIAKQTNSSRSIVIYIFNSFLPN